MGDGRVIWRSSERDSGRNPACKQVSVLPSEASTDVELQLELGQNLADGARDRDKIRWILGSWGVGTTSTGASPIHQVHEDN